MSNTPKYPLILVLDMPRGKSKLKFCQKANDSFFSKQIKKKRRSFFLKQREYYYYYYLLLDDVIKTFEMSCGFVL